MYIHHKDVPPAHLQHREHRGLEENQHLIMPATTPSMIDSVVNRIPKTPEISQTYTKEDAGFLQHSSNAYLHCSDIPRGR